MSNDFDPDKFLASESIPSNSKTDDFNPDKFLAEPVSQTESLLRGVTQGATLGYSDEIVGGIEALWSIAKGDPTEFGKLYAQHRDESRNNNKTAQKENPWAYGAGEVGGGFATAFVPGLNIAKGAKMAQVVGQTALQGGLAGFGQAEGDIQDQLISTGIGAGLGGAIGGIGGAIGQKLGKSVDNAGKFADDTVKDTSEWFANKAERKAAGSLGLSVKDYKLLSEQEVKDLGKELLLKSDKGERILKPQYLSRNTKKELLETQAREKIQGQALGKIRTDLDQAVPNLVETKPIIAKIESELASDYTRAGSRDTKPHYDNLLDTIKELGENTSLDELEKTKQYIGRMADYGKVEPSEKAKVARQFYDIVKDFENEYVGKGSVERQLNHTIDETVEAQTNLFKNSGVFQEEFNSFDPISYGEALKKHYKKNYSSEAKVNELSNDFQNQKYTYGNLKKIENKLQGLDATANKSMDKGLVSVIPDNTLDVGKVLRGILSVGINNRNIALSAQNISEMLAKNPQIFGKFSGVLQNASRRGPQALASSHFLLQQNDPSYRTLIKGLEEEGESNDK